ncbi:hypothetical protein KAR91_50375 [Candidatus Pacearchaeota archaeon]|nr:hypothetical protein [Candidatus Pacearchaeota archaeon]
MRLLKNELNLKKILIEDINPIIQHHYIDSWTLKIYGSSTNNLNHNGEWIKDPQWCIREFLNHLLTYNRPHDMRDILEIEFSEIQCHKPNESEPHFEVGQFPLTSQNNREQQLDDVWQMLHGEDKTSP